MKSRLLGLSGAIAGALLSNMSFSYGGDGSFVRALESGSQPKADAALKKMEAERKALILKLRDSFAKAKKKDDTLTMRNVMLALGKLRAIEALDVIVDNIDLALPVKNPLDVNSMEIPMTEQCPAIPALIDIGPGVSEKLLSAVAEGKLTQEGVRTVGYVIVHFYGEAEGKRTVEAFASKIEDKESKNRVLSKSLLMFFEISKRKVESKE